MSSLAQFTDTHSHKTCPARDFSKCADEKWKNTESYENGLETSYNRLLFVSIVSDVLCVSGVNRTKVCANRLSPLVSRPKVLRSMFIYSNDWIGPKQGCVELHATNESCSVRCRVNA